MVWKTCFEPSQTFALQVSELSERQSVGSFEISSSSEDDFEDGDGTEEEDERDQEYTIYSVLPNRQLEVVNKLPAKSQNLRPKKTSAERRSVGSVSITSAPQSCSVHEGKILTLTCEVAGPKYTGGRATSGWIALFFLSNSSFRCLLVSRVHETGTVPPPLALPERSLAPPGHLRH